MEMLFSKDFILRAIQFYVEDREPEFQCKFTDVAQMDDDDLFILLGE
jgi:hypothetical protein